MKRRNLSLIISGLLGVIAILSGIYLMAASVTNYIAESQKTDWIVTEARITDVSSRVKRNSRSSTTFYDLTYQYEADGKTYTGKKSSVSGIRLVGDEIKIKYDPDNPSDSTSDITPNKDDLIYPFGGGVLFLAAGIFFLLTAIKRSKRLKNEDEAHTETSENSRNPKRTIIALLLMAAIIALTLVFLRAQPSGIETFSSVMTENGYTVSDMTDELRTDWRVGSLIEDSRSLHTEDMRIDFCVMDSTDSARRIYSGMTLPVKDGKEYTYKSTNYSIFSIEDDNLYTAKIYSGNTVIYAAAPSPCSPAACALPCPMPRARRGCWSVWWSTLPRRSGCPAAATGTRVLSAARFITTQRILCSRPLHCWRCWPFTVSGRRCAMTWICVPTRSTRCC